jgi:hypothetical protein
MENNDRYIGDGVYVSFDGYCVVVAVSHHENDVVALEPQVLENLIQYAKDMKVIEDK